MQLINKKISDLKEYENNPRDNTAAVDAVANSIKEFGFKVPIIVDGNNVIIAGHTRFKAAISLGLEEVPCIVANDLTPEQVKAFRLADNKVGEIASWDLDKLKLELENIDGLDMSLFGFEVDVEPDEVFEDDFDPNEHIPETPLSQIGDIYILGNHRLTCGDSAKEEDIKRLVDGKQIDLVLTDPPYNVDVGAKGDGNEQFDNRRIKNDNMPSDDFLAFLVKVFKNMREVLKEGGSYYVCHGSSTLVEFDRALQLNNLKPRQQLIWNKNSLVLGRQDFQWRHECIYYGWKEGKAHYFIDDRTITTVIDAPSLDFKSMKKEELIQRLEDVYSLKNSVLNHDKPTKNDLHPTMKPISLLADLLKYSSKVGENVMDPFGGSGSTLIACEELKRNAFLNELDENYVDVIVKRYIKLKGSTENCYLIRNGIKEPLSDIEVFKHTKEID
ncbi:DNA modification methylase [Acholeplasma vituli]|uniref:Methyltransferase n=1 Tax=Paracholeplasma vituli TaxID=69473 RepID=A0ABT2PU14_9MOLU|nr:DNA modification methylase [Paracholeplasma vituli]MCU0104426.1 DNA modification methylase [Paracholeplasma vituli]